MGKLDSPVGNQSHPAIGVGARTERQTADSDSIGWRSGAERKREAPYRLFSAEIVRRAPDEKCDGRDHADGGESAGAVSEQSGDSEAVLERLDKLEQMVQEMNERLKSIDTRLPPPKP